MFTAQERKAKITAATPEAEAERTAIDKLIASLKELNTIKLDNLSSQFNQLNQIVGETQKSTSDVLKGYLGGSGFDVKKLLSAPFLAFGNQQIDKLIPTLFSGLYQKSPEGSGTLPQGIAGFNPIGDLFGSIGSLFGGGGNNNSKAGTLGGTDRSVGLSLQQPLFEPSIIAPPDPTSQFEGMPLSSSKLETDIPVLTSAIQSLTAAITNNPIASSIPEANSNLFSDEDDPFAGSELANSFNPTNLTSSIGSSIASGLGSILSQGQKSGGNSWIGAGLSLAGSLFGFATGGIKEGIAPISSGIIGSGRSQVDNRLALVEDGEGVLTHLGVDTLGGSSALSKINRGIKIPMFANGGIKGANYSTPTPDTSTPNVKASTGNFNNISVGVNVNNSGGNKSVETKEDGSKLGKLIDNAISSALVREQRPGGLLYT